jgi:DUF971 family protein
MAGPDPSCYPLDLDLQRSVALRIRWEDGVETITPLDRLRAACPCATCRAMREERARNPLAVLPRAANPAEMTTVRSAELAGSYALRITWMDGHDTGIYDFRLLRSLGAAGAGQDSGP